MKPMEITINSPEQWDEFLTTYKNPESLPDIAILTFSWGSDDERAVTVPEEYSWGMRKWLIEVKDSASVEIFSPRCHVRATGSPRLEVTDAIDVDAYGDCHVVASGSSRIYAHGSTQVTAVDEAYVCAYGTCYVDASGRADAYVYDSCSVDASDRARVCLEGTCRATIVDHVYCEARDMSEVTAYGNAQVVAEGGSIVRATGFARVRVEERARVWAGGSADIHARHRSTVYAMEGCHLLAEDLAVVQEITPGTDISASETCTLIPALPADASRESELQFARGLSEYFLNHAPSPTGAVLGNPTQNYQE